MSTNSNTCFAWQRVQISQSYDLEELVRNYFNGMAMCYLENLIRKQCHMCIDAFASRLSSKLAKET